MLPRRQYAVAITRGRNTRYFWGERLKDAVALAKPRDGEAFTFTRYEREAIYRATQSGSRLTIAVAKGHG